MAEIMPVPCAAITKPHQVKRRVFCMHYGDCLDVAIENEWTNFSCETCGSYEDERLGPGFRKGEEERFVILAYLSIPQE